MSRFLGPTGRGEYVLISLAATTLAVLGKFGLDQANVHMLGTRRGDPTRLAAQNALVSFLVLPMGLLVLAAGSSALPEVFGGVPIVYFLLAALTAMFQTHIQLAGALQNLRGTTTWQFRAIAYGLAFQLAIVALLLAVGRFDVTSALVANLAGSALTWALVISRDDLSTLAGIDRDVLTATIRYAFVVHIGLVLFFLQARVNQFIVKADVGAAGLGIYSLAVAIAESLILPSDSIAIALLPRQTRHDLPGAARLALFGCALGAASTLVGAVALILIGDRLIALVFGDSFRPAYPSLLVLLPGVICLATQRFCGFAVLRADRPLLIMAIYATGMVVNVVGNMLWISSHGLIGAALAVTASYVVTCGLFLIWTLQLAFRAGTR